MSRLLPEEYPRVLVVGGAAFSRTSGTGITLSNLFAGWPRDRLAQLYTEDREPTTDVCASFAHVGQEIAPVEHHLIRLRRWTQRSERVTATGGARANGTVRMDQDPGPVRAWLRKELTAFFDLTPIRPPAHLRDWVRAQQPQVVYATLGSIRMMRLALMAARECDVPLVPHFMDDWATTLYAQGQVLGLPRQAVRRELRAVLRQSSYGLGISGPMAREYERRYRLPFAAFGNCVDAEDFAVPGHPVPPRPDGAAIELVYVGGLHLGRWRSLRRIGEAMDQLAGEGVAARLTVHMPQQDVARYGGHLADLAAVRLGRSLSSTEVAAVLRGADVLVHVESFAEDNRAYTRYSLSTKIPQYLAAGRPVLGFGPVELASMAHLREADAGVVVGVDDPVTLSRELARLCQEAGLRERLGRQGLAFAVRHHRSDQVALRLAEVLGEAARRSIGPPSAPRAEPPTRSLTHVVR
ncbi:glycosyl transferase family 1 [Micromonospora sp. NPDC047465]|uniref:glycosyltransferase family protein n=1 Tax=Micromonospora sp. NPDC047465 TaxID=3154813 RepID=UPI0033D2515E